MSVQQAPLPIDGQRYRQVLGQYPTGVCVVSAIVAGESVAMVVGSFTSVSLDPPLVAFFPDKNSSSWAKLRNAAHFCINILSADQENVCRVLASKDPDEFRGVAHRTSELGNPILSDVVAWIECERYSITDAGDHDMMLGRISAFDIATGELPLLFFQGGYGRFATSSLAAQDMSGISPAQLRNLERARPEMERLADGLDARCLATVRVGRELVVVASAGQGSHSATATLVGQRLPFAPPTGAVFAAWLPPVEKEKWAHSYKNTDPAETIASLDRVRTRGYSVSLVNDAQRAFVARLTVTADAPDPSHPDDFQELIQGLLYDPADMSPSSLDDVRQISVPVIDSAGKVTLALTLHDFPKPSGERGVLEYIERAVAAASTVSAGLAAKRP